MNFKQLLHAIRASCEISGDFELWIYGSQSILGNFSQAAQISALSTSIEVDVTPKNLPQKVDDIDGSLGDGSPFHAAHGFYVHGVPISEAAVLPSGWENRCVKLLVKNLSDETCTAYCLEVHDLLASKLVRFEDKDREFARVALLYGLAEAGRVIIRVNNLPIKFKDSARICAWIERIAADLPKRSSEDIVGLPYGTIAEGEGHRVEFPEDPDRN